MPVKPLSEATEAGARAPAARGAGAEAAGAQGSGASRDGCPRVGLAIGDLMSASRVREIVRAAGGESFAVASVVELSAQAGRVSLVVIDLGPREKALALIRAIRAERALAGLRLAAFVAHVDVATRDAALAAGCDDVLPRSSFFDRLPALLSPPGRG